MGLFFISYARILAYHSKRFLVSPGRVQGETQEPGSMFPMTLQTLLYGYRLNSYASVAAGRADIDRRNACKYQNGPFG
jgi:hypothetical protein